MKSTNKYIFPFDKSTLDNLFEITSTEPKTLLTWFKHALKFCRKDKKENEAGILPSWQSTWQFPCLCNKFNERWNFVDTPADMAFVYKNEAPLPVNTKARVSISGIFDIWKKAVKEEKYAEFLINTFNKMYNIKE